MKHIFFEWEMIMLILDQTLCVCKTKCTCKVSDTINQRKREDQVMQFLRGLNDQSNNLKSYMLLMEPIPYVPKLFPWLLKKKDSCPVVA